MKKVLSLIILMMLSFLPINGATFQGGVSEQGASNSSRIIDKQTGLGIGGADVSLPKQNYRTKTDNEGYFELDTQINGPSIMSVKKENYKPFSMTIDEKSMNAPIVVGIEKSNASGGTSMPSRFKHSRYAWCRGSTCISGSRKQCRTGAR